ncbi:MAG: hypothetical protein M3Y86_10650, partial [Verrucomicrobiota bacterium]|nr:hypothetical protein [Verrucomicrobiota bacterium]
MLEVKLQFPLPLPDDPHKWDGWAKYKSPNFYERLCLDPRQHPGDDLIEEHCRELLRWWQKKLPLKNQPSNPLAQLLRPGLEESSHYLTEARVELLDPARRRQMDNELAAQAQEEAVAEFHKFLTFAIADGMLSIEAEKSLMRFGHEHGLATDQVRRYIEAELVESGARRALPPEAAPAPPPPPKPARPARQPGDPKEEFLRMLRLTSLDSDGMSDDTRDAFINMAENIGLDPGDAEDLVDLYLEEADAMANGAPPPPRATTPAPPPARPAVKAAAPETEPSVVVAAPVKMGAVLEPFINSLGQTMLCVPGGEFLMGSEAP